MEELLIKKAQGMFYIGEKEQPLAYITYKPVREGVIAVDHTVVDKSLEGQGIGSRLFNTIIEFSKEEGVKIIPVCSFVKAKFDKKPELAELRAEAE